LTEKALLIQFSLILNNGGKATWLSVINNYKIVCILQCLVILSLNFPYPFTKKLITYKIKKVKEIGDSNSTTSTFQPCSELEDEFTWLEIPLRNESSNHNSCFAVLKY